MKRIHYLMLLCACALISCRYPAAPEDSYIPFELEVASRGSPSASNLLSELPEGVDVTVTITDADRENIVYYKRTTKTNKEPLTVYPNLPLRAAVRISVVVDSYTAAWKGETTAIVGQGPVTLAIPRKPAILYPFVYKKIGTPPKYELAVMRPGRGAQTLAKDMPAPLAFERGWDGAVYVLVDEGAPLSRKVKKINCLGDDEGEITGPNPGFVQDICVDNSDGTAYAIQHQSGTFASVKLFSLKDTTSFDGQSIDASNIRAAVSGNTVYLLYKDTSSNNYMLAKYLKDGTNFIAGSPTTLSPPISITSVGGAITHEFTDLYVDGDDVYALFHASSETSPYYYSIGGVTHIKDTGVRLDVKSTYGCNNILLPYSLTSVSVASPDSFVSIEEPLNQKLLGPKRFIGRQGSRLYIADDGFAPHVHTGSIDKLNLNRILGFCTEAEALHRYVTPPNFNNDWTWDTEY